MTIGRLFYLKSEAILMTDKQLNQVDLDLPKSGFVSIFIPEVITHLYLK